MSIKPILTTLAVAALATLQTSSANAWPVVAYDQFSGTFDATCSAPTARLNIVIGRATGNTLNERLANIFAIPVSLPMAVTCDDGPLEVDASAQIERIRDLCEKSRWETTLCNELFLGQLENLREIFTATLPPVLETVTFDWRPNGFTWLFGVNVSNSVYEFDDGVNTSIFQNLIRGSKQVPVLDAEGQPVLNADGNPTTRWTADDTHGIYLNLANVVREYNWKPAGELGNYCSAGMLIHTDGHIRSAEPTRADGVMDVLRAVNCAFPMPNGDYIGISISTAVEYDWNGEARVAE